MNYLKLINSKEKNKQMYLKNEEFPPSVIIETTNFCNLQCSICEHKSMSRKKGNMHLATYKKAIDEISIENPETEVWLAFYGEALILKYKLVYLIDYAKKAGLKHVFLNTNGLLLDEELSEALIESGLDKIVFSLDAYYDETYKKIRCNDNFEKAKSNILKFVEIRDKLNSNIDVQVQLVRLENIHSDTEVELFKSYWEGLGIQTKIKRYITWTNSNAHYNIRNSGRYPCSWLFRTFVITWNGDVAQCGCDYECKYIAGNIKNESVKSVWQDSLKAVRDLHLREEYCASRVCGNCRDWDSYELLPFLR